MKRRCALLFLLAWSVGLSGCSGTARRSDGTSIFGPGAWSIPTAPAQQAVTLTAARPAQASPSTDPSAQPRGLSRYFPSLRRDNLEAANVVAAAPRPTWFGLRSPKPVASQTYMTDARANLNRPGPEPTSLPVALQVPSDRPSSDRMVTPTNAETTAPDRVGPSTPIDDQAPKPPVVPPSALDFGGKPAAPGEDEVNPLPPATEPAKDVAGMPHVPSVDPLDDPKPKSDPGKLDDSAPDDHAVKVSTEADMPASPPKPPEPKAPVEETSKTIPASTAVYATPQGPPPRPTSQAKPSPQAATAAAPTEWKRPCLRRLVRRVCKMGEYATPPTAAPH